MNTRQYRTAQRLAKLASDEGTTFEADRNAEVLKDHYTWYPVTATRLADGEQWPYLLRAEYGSYAGSHTPEFLEPILDEVPRFQPEGIAGDMWEEFKLTNS